MPRISTFLCLVITIISLVFDLSKVRADSLSPDFLRRIETFSDFIGLNERTSYGSSFQVEWVKFMYLPKEAQTYFQQSHIYKLHHDFASKHLDLFLGMDEVRFKNHTQYKANRLAFVGSLLRFPGDLKSSWGIQIISQDSMEIEEIKTVFESILEAAPFLNETGRKSEIYLIPTNEQKNDFKLKEAALGTPVVDNFYLCRYLPQEGLFADPDLIPAQSEFLGGMYRIRMKHLISDLHKQPYLKTYNSVPQEVTFEGIIGEPFTLKSWWAMVYTAHHHNFYEEFLFDMEKDETLDPIILGKLRQKNLRWIHLYRGMPDETETRNFKLAQISPSGERTELGALKAKNFPFDFPAPASR